MRIDQPGEPVEWAVKMQRLADDATLESRLERDEPIEAAVETLAVRLADFHAAAERGSHIAEFGSFAVVERNALENFEQAAPHVGTVISPAVFQRLRELTVAELARRKGLIEARAARSVPCDTHGDLRLGHVYWMPELTPPDDLVVIDCIEFNERFRYADPVADMAFMAMGLARSGRRDLERLFVEAYFRASGDREGRELLPLYVAYRAAVRGKVDAMQAARAEIPAAQRDAALSKSRGYWLAALGALEAPDRRPCLLLVGGLPGTGKSTLAAELVTRSGCELIRSDQVRKELAGKLVTSDASATFEQGIYTPEWTERTYAECLRRAEEHLFEGRRVVVDASFRQDAPRRQFLAAADHWGVPAMLWVCQADTEVVRQRIAAQARRCVRRRLVDPPAGRGPLAAGRPAGRARAGHDQHDRRSGIYLATSASGAERKNPRPMRESNPRPLGGEGGLRSKPGEGQRSRRTNLSNLKRASVRPQRHGTAPGSQTPATDWVTHPLAPCANLSASHGDSSESKSGHPRRRRESRPRRRRRNRPWSG